MSSKMSNVKGQHKQKQCEQKMKSKTKFFPEQESRKRRPRKLRPRKRSPRKRRPRKLEYLRIFAILTLISYTSTCKSGRFHPWVPSKMCIFSFWKTRWCSFNQLKQSNVNGQHKQKQCEQKMKSKTFQTRTYIKMK